VDHNLSRVFFKGLGQVIEVEGKANPELYETDSLACHDAAHETASAGERRE
jgi:hypothetical protein